MWMMLARTLVVFIVWGALLAVGLALGIPPQVAELMAVTGAGLTLLARAAFTKTAGQVSTVPESKSAAQRRASV